VVLTVVIGCAYSQYISILFLIFNLSYRSDFKFCVNI
jgi:hypothetical protein